MDELKEQIKAHALRELPKECCGFVLRENDELKAEPSENTSEHPETMFRVSPTAYLAAKQGGKLAGYYHSHPDDTEAFSDADKAIAEALQLPLYLYVVGTDLLICYIPTGYSVPLEGRKFIPRVFDCWSIIHDYYSARGIVLPYISRDSGDDKGYPNLREYIESEQMRIVTVPQPHDIILMALNSNLPNHAAIYIGDGIMIHQRANETSRRDVYGGYWAKNTVLILRHPKTAKP